MDVLPLRTPAHLPVAKRKEPAMRRIKKLLERLLRLPLPVVFA